MIRSTHWLVGATWQYCQEKPVSVEGKALVTLPNGLRYLRVGGCRLNSLYGKMLKCKIISFSGANPTRQVLACKRNPTGLLSGAFLDMLRLFSERERVSGNAA